MVKCLKTWKKLTTNPEILDTVKGDIIEFENDIPIFHLSKNPTFTESETMLIEKEIKKVPSKNIIVESVHEEIEFISPIFIEYKKDENVLLILNLKKLNEYVECNHFKWKTLRQC